MILKIKSVMKTWSQVRKHHLVSQREMWTFYVIPKVSHHMHTAFFYKSVVFGLSTMEIFYMKSRKPRNLLITGYLNNVKDSGICYWACHF